MNARVGALKHVFQSLILAGSSFALATFAAEGVLRLFPQLLPLELQLRKANADPSKRGLADPQIGNRLPPHREGTIWTRDFKHNYVTDSEGFRNEEPWPNPVDAVVIGDSLVWGYGVQRSEAWPQLLARESGTSVLNLGISGTGPQQFLRIYESVAVDLQPKLVVVGFFNGNDFWDASLFEQWLEQGSPGNYLVWRDFGRQRVHIGWRHPRATIRALLERHSYLYGLLRYSVRALVSVTSGNVRELVWSDGVTLQLLPQTTASMLKHAVYGDRVFEAVVSSITQLRDKTAEDGGRMVVVLQPSKEEVYMPFLGQPLPDYMQDFRAALEEHGIEYLDLGPVFRERAAQGARLFFPIDGHPNAEGYALTAQEVARFVRDTGLLPERRGG